MNKVMEKQRKDDSPLFGLWVYLMTDGMLFASLFATFAVLRNSTFGGPSGAELFSLSFALLETLILLTSSFTIGIAMWFAHQRDVRAVLFWVGLTFILGALFLSMELQEFSHLVQEGQSWRQSAFLSSFFTLVGTHGLHIIAGLVWCAFVVLQIMHKGLDGIRMKRLAMLAMFWHFLDVIWIFIFSIVYLLGGIT